MQPFPVILQSWKTLAPFQGWSDPDESGYLWFDMTFEINGLTEAEIVFHGGCYLSKPDCNVTLEIRVRKRPGKRCIPLARIDWRSLQGGHTNPRGRPPWGGQRVAPTHIHDFGLNLSESNARMKGTNLPIAMSIRPEPQSFEELRAYAGHALRINNIDVVTIPDWQYGLF